MTFQQTVSRAQAFGVVGEIFLGGPWRAQPGIIDSAGGTPNFNRVGRVFTQVAGSDGHCVVGGTGTFFGILANPKVYASQGSSSGTLAPSLDLPQYGEGEFVYDTTGIIVDLTGLAANVGDQAYYDTTSGVIGTQADGAPSSGAQRVAFASNVATVTLTPAGTPPIGVGSVITSADGQTAVVSAVLTGTGGNGTYTVSTVTDHAAQAFSFAKAVLPSGKARIPGFQVVRYNLDTSDTTGVIGVVN